MNKYTNVMLDLETMGARPGAAIVSIGAVTFSSGIVNDSFYMRPNLESCVEAGLTMDAGTVLWWLGQSHEARAGVTTSDGTIHEVLIEFTKFLQSAANGREVLMWGNGADFDNALLAEAYRVLVYRQPWRYYHNRCYRTMKAMRPEIPLERVGTHHNALDDARSQALHLMKLFPELAP